MLDAVCRKDVERGLAEIGLQPGDTVMVHSSLRSFGHVEGGAEVVIAALQAVLGRRGCLAMPTITLGMDETSVRFDVRHTPSTSGRITEVFRGMPDVSRSHHPFSSAAAWGWAAKEMTAYHIVSPCSLTSPYGQVYLRGGYSLFMGVDLGSNSLFHVAEEIVSPPYLRYATFPDAVVIDEEGREQRVTACRYNCYQTGVHRHLERMAEVFAAAGVVRCAKVGGSAWRLLPARANVEMSAEALRTRPEYLLDDGDAP